MADRLNYAFLTPEKLRELDDKELTRIIELLNVTSADLIVVRDLIKDRNDFRRCYNKLVHQLQDLGVEPCTDYYKFSARSTGRTRKNV